MDLITRASRSGETEPGPDRSVVVTASDDSTDRYGDRILVDGTLDGRKFGDGWRTKDYERNPVVPFAHDYSSLPVARVDRLWADEIGGRKRLRARMVFATSNPVAETVLGLFKEGVLRAVSVGFRAIETYWPSGEKERQDLELGPFGSIYATADLWEISVVPVPANANALTEGLRCDQKSALCNLASVAEAHGFKEAALTIRSAVGSRKTFDLGARAIEEFERGMRRRLGLPTTERHDSRAGGEPQEALACPQCSSSNLECLDCGWEAVEAQADAAEGAELRLLKQMRQAFPTTTPRHVVVPNFSRHIDRYIEGMRRALRCTGPQAQRS